MPAWSEDSDTLWCGLTFHTPALARQRIKKAQYNPRLSTRTRGFERRVVASPAVCPVTPTGPGTGTCFGSGTEACTFPFYTVSLSGITLTVGSTWQRRSL